MTKTESTRSVGVYTTREGDRHPYVQLQLLQPASARELSAELHRLAAKVELATPFTEQWNVHLSTITYSPPTGWVYIELGFGSEEELNRAYACLARVANAD